VIAVPPTPVPAKMPASEPAPDAAVVNWFVPP
jgi:hypothetical protein